MAKDSYCEISQYYGIPTVEQLITNRYDRFLSRYRCQKIMYVKHWLRSLRLWILKYCLLVYINSCCYYYHATSHNGENKVVYI